MIQPKRNPQAVLAAIAHALTVLPDLRVGQLIVNALGSAPFDFEDDAAAAAIVNYAEEVRTCTCR